MELTLFVVVIALVVAFTVLLRRRRVRAQWREVQRLPRRTDETVRAEQDPEVQDRATRDAAPASPPRQGPGRSPGDDNLERLNPD